MNIAPPNSIYICNYCDFPTEPLIALFSSKAIHIQNAAENWMPDCLKTYVFFKLFICLLKIYLLRFTQYTQ